MTAGNRYSTAVSLAKVVLPLGALALLSTLFLFSRTPDPDAALPYADLDVEQLVREQRLSRPRFAGTLADGREVTLTANSAAADMLEPNTIMLTAIDAHLVLSAEDNMTLTAERGDLDLAAQAVALAGSVGVVTRSGYMLAADALTIAMDTMRLTAPGPVTLTGPGLTIEAGAMEMTGPEDGVFLGFTGGVRLLYDGGN